MDSVAIPGAIGRVRKSFSYHLNYTNYSDFSPQSQVQFLKNLKKFQNFSPGPLYFWRNWVLLRDYKKEFPGIPQMKPSLDFSSKSGHGASAPDSQNFSMNLK